MSEHPPEDDYATAIPIVVEGDEPPWWAKAWAFTRKYILAPIPILIILAVAVVAIILGAKNVQIGGLIGKVLGRKDGHQKAIDVANSIPEDRVDGNGNLIPIGAPDSQGITQARVVPIQQPGIFDDPKKVKITGKDGKAVVVDLPDGVRAKEVDKVVIVSPTVTAVTVKSTSKVKAAEVDDLINKYGNL